MQYGFYFDQQRCTGCYACSVMCKQWHGIPAGPASWLRVETIETGRYPHVGVAHVVLTCFHCIEPACVPACPEGAITKRNSDGVVTVDQAACTACRLCLDACPYRAPQFRDDRAKMEKCDLCLDRLEDGEQPLCVVACPLRALDVGPLEELQARYQAVEQTAIGLPDPSLTRPAAVFRPRTAPGE